MHLSIEQAAEALGKTPRQIRYLVKSGKLKASKVGGRWRIDSDDLPKSAAQTEATERKQAELIAAVEDTLEVPPQGQRKRYSIQNLRAFQIGAPLYREAVTALGPEHPACQALEHTLASLARGCHRYADADKIAAYLEARDAASLAACKLALTEHDRALTFLDCIEQELMAAIAGLIRRLERLRRQPQPVL